MSKKLVLLLLVICGAFSLGAPALALAATTQSYQVRIVAIVPPMRTLYVKDGTLVKVASNSTQNVDPTAVDLKTSDQIELTNKVAQQYQYFLALHNNYLKPGFYWLPSPTAATNIKPAKAPLIASLKLSLFKSVSG